MRPLIEKLEIAILNRNPLLGKKLQPGLPIEKITRDLKRADIKGAIDPIIELYSWRNGTILDMDLASSKTGFAPEMVYNFTELRRAIVDMQSFKVISRYHPKYSELIGRYFPMLWDGSNGWIAVDVLPSCHNRVVTILSEDDQPLREAYASFDEFLKDVIRANEENDNLTCFQMQ